MTSLRWSYLFIYHEAPNGIIKKKILLVRMRKSSQIDHLIFRVLIGWNDSWVISMTRMFFYSFEVTFAVYHIVTKTFRNSILFTRNDAMQFSPISRHHTKYESSICTRYTVWNSIMSGTTGGTTGGYKVNNYRMYRVHKVKICLWN